MPPEVQAKLTTLGEIGKQWLATIDAKLLEISNIWELKLGHVLPGGSGGIVIDVHQKNGTAAVLKIGIPDIDHFEKEAIVLEYAMGRGYVELLKRYKKESIFLLEKLGPTLESLDTSVEKKLAILCQTLKKAWLQPKPTLNLMTGEEKADWLKVFIKKNDENYPNSINRLTFNQVMTFIEARKSAYDLSNSVLVHGDAHFQNILQTKNTTGTINYKFIDPDGLIAEPAYDLGISMRELNASILEGNILENGLKRSRLLAKLTDVSEIAIWQWGFIERVSTGLYLKALGWERESKDTLLIADVWAQRVI